MEVFNTIREFKNKFPSGLYICPKCGAMTNDKYVCSKCNNQSNNLFYKGYEYEIKETNTIETIFKPIESRFYS